MLQYGVVKPDDQIEVDRPKCVLTPSKSEGPYFVEEGLLRSDIRADPTDGTRQEGAPLDLAIEVVRADDSCRPVQGIHVDIWHCNALGVYSDVSGDGTVGRKFLRGCQETSALGEVRFTTIFPGWYSGRSVHIHLKARCLDDNETRYEFTSQLFFEPEVVEEVFTAHAPYNSRGRPDTVNADDSIFGADGWKLIVPISSTGGGYAGTMRIGLSGLPS